MSLSEITWATLVFADQTDPSDPREQPKTRGSTNILVPEMFQELELAVRPLRQNGRAERLHNLLHRDTLVRELVPRGTVHMIR